MPLTCEYPDEVHFDGWQYEPPEDFTVFDRSKRKRCCSCKNLINKGDECLKFERFRPPKSEIEEAIVGEEVYLAPFYMCYRCGEIFLNLSALGYCIILPENMEELLEEYQDMTGFKAQEDN